MWSILLRRAIERYGNDDFVIVPDRRMSVRVAEQASGALARHMLPTGADKGSRVGIILPTGMEWTVAWLAADRIGAKPMASPATYRPAELRGFRRCNSRRSRRIRAQLQPPYVFSSDPSVDHFDHAGSLPCATRIVNPLNGILRAHVL
jgi:acyl-CoA synthetase (AMP-forming)/AMP-acid ligase II